MRILITNDDGIDAPGIQRLTDVARLFGEPVVVAPVEALSGCSHQVTSHGPIRIEERGPECWAIHGMPADCVRIGLHELASDIDWVFSGINAGGNLGVDLFMSGTVAAIREAALLGKPGIAVSQYRRTGTTIRGEDSAERTRRAIEFVLTQPTPAPTFWNVNLPDPEDASATSDLVVCPPCRQHLLMAFESDGDAVHYQGDYQRRPRHSGDDVDVCFGGDIAISQLSAWGAPEPGADR